MTGFLETPDSELPLTITNDCEGDVQSRVVTTIPAKKKEEKKMERLKKFKRKNYSER